jgi:predicted enzyme related to lactoylglutathione lyase
MDIVLNVDVSDLDAGVAFYMRAFSLRVHRAFDGFVELVGARIRIYLLHKPSGTPPFENANAPRSYERHWTPLHFDVVVADVEAAVARARDAGARIEGEIREETWGRIAQLSDPFGNGFCVLSFSARGYDALLPDEQKKRLLVVAHAPSGNTERMLDALSRGAHHPEATDVVTRVLPALDARADDVLSAHAVALLTPENLGYMSGAMKDFFDRIYEPCLEHTRGRPFAVVIRAKHDGTGTRRAIESITTGLGWRAVEAPMICHGAFDERFLEDCEALGGKLAVGLAYDML